MLLSYHHELQEVTGSKGLPLPTTAYAMGTFIPNSHTDPNLATPCLIDLCGPSKLGPVWARGEQ